MGTGRPKADHKSLMEEALRAAPKVLTKWSCKSKLENKTQNMQFGLPAKIVSTQHFGSNLLRLVEGTAKACTATPATEECNKCDLTVCSLILIGQS
jgi:hypothetical protein